MRRLAPILALLVLAALPVAAHTKPAPWPNTSLPSSLENTPEIALPTIVTEADDSLEVFTAKRKLASGVFCFVVEPNIWQTRELGGKSWQGHDYMHARYYNPNFARFLSIDPEIPTGDALKHPQRWNRYRYATNNPLLRVDRDGRNDNWFLDFITGLIGSGTDRVPQAAGGTMEENPQPPDEKPMRQANAQQLGRQTGEFLQDNDFVVEGSVSLNAPLKLQGATFGIAVVDGDDVYGFAGGQRSFGISPPVSLNLQLGIVANYDGAGSYKGPFVSLTSSSPIGLGFAGNPLDPNGPNSTFISVSTEVSVGGQTVTYYTPLTAKED